MLLLLHVGVISYYKFVVQDTSDVLTQTGNLTHRNNISLNALAIDFASQLGTAIIALKGLGAANFTTSALKPDSTSSIGGNSDPFFSCHSIA